MPVSAPNSTPKVTSDTVLNSDAHPDHAAAGTSDQHVRKQALDVSQSFVVEAPAGSGKTELLCQRFLALLTTVARPEGVVAMTFTRKAAGEMRDRITRALHDARDNVPITESHRQATRDLAHQVLTHANKHQWHLLDNPSRLQIYTVDGLCARLISQMPLRSGFGRPPAMAMFPEELYQTAAKQLLQRLSRQSHESASPNGTSQPFQCLLSHLDNRVYVVERLIVDMLSQRDRWLRLMPLGMQPSTQIQLRAALEHTLATLLEGRMARLNTQWPSTLGSEFFKLARIASDNLRHGTSADKPASPIVSLSDIAAPLTADASRLSQWQGLAEMLLRRDGERRQQINKTIGFPVELKAEKGQLKELISTLAEHPAWVAQLAEVRGFPNPAFSDEQWDVCLALFEILPQAVAELKIVFGTAGEVDFTEVSHAALRALGDTDRPTDLALYQDYRIQHLLVDEFQDTSHSQVALLEHLTAGWTPDDGRTLFVVGDPMQSIYRFREAEVGLFIQALGHGIGDVALSPLQLTQNFRSERALVDWFNQHFPAVLAERDRIDDGAIAYRPAHSPKIAEKTQNAGVFVHPQATPDRETEAKAICDLIHTIQSDSDQASIGILVRSRSHLWSLFETASQRGIAINAVDIDPLLSNAAAMDLHMLYRATLQLADRASWLAVLRAPWCGLTLNELHTLATADADRTLWQQLHNPDLLNTLSGATQTRIMWLRSVLNAHFQSRHQHTTQDGLMILWRELCADTFHAQAIDHRAIADYLDVVTELDDNASAISLEQLEARLAQRLLPGMIDNQSESTVPAVQVMTIHRAKGLEFDAVILPGLGRRSGIDRDPLLTWIERPQQPAGEQLLLSPIRSVREDDPLYRFLRKLDGQRAAHERQRVLYVACTRARTQLHLFGHAPSSAKDPDIPKPMANTFLADLWPAISNEFEPTERDTLSILDVPDTNEVDSVAMPGNIRRLTNNAVATLHNQWQQKNLHASEATAVTLTNRPEFLWAGRRIREVGRLVHRWIEEIEHDGVSAWQSRSSDEIEAIAKQQVERLRLNPSDHQMAIATTIKAITNALSDERFHWLIDPCHTAAHSEYALSGWLDNTWVNAIIDRTFIDEQGTRWIVDYKSSDHKGTDLDDFLHHEQDRYAPQLQRYAEMLKLREPSRAIRCGLYFPLLKAWREWALNSH